MPNRPRRLARWRGTAALVALLTASAGVQIATAAPEPVGAIPTVEGPIAGTPFGAVAYNPTGAGYVEEEYFVSGTASNVGAAPGSATATAPYKVRMLVYRPTSANRFNGSAIVEWENVTGQRAAAPMFYWLDSYAIRSGYVYVQVAAQATPAPAGLVGHGELGHVAADPARYGSLKHPGDDFSFDIYTQAMRSLTQRLGADPTGGLKVERVVATGNSQSANRLHTYLQRVQETADVADAFLVDAGGGKTFPELDAQRKELAVPVIHLLSEDGFTVAMPNRTTNYRLWEVAGASHADADTTRNASVRRVPGSPRRSWAEQEKLWDERHYGEEGLSTHATCAYGVGGNEYPRRYAVAAAVHHLVNWVKNGLPAPQPPRVEYGADGNPLKDAYGNVKGGLRLPPIDVPVATYHGDACVLFGFNLPLDPVTLGDLYESHDIYVEKMQAATDEAVAAGYLLPRDAEELMGLARRSSVGG